MYICGIKTCMHTVCTAYYDAEHTPRVERSGGTKNEETDPVSNLTVVDRVDHSTFKSFPILAFNQID